MRRRSFRPTLDSLDFRITPSNMTGVSAAIAIPTSSSVLGDGSENENPLWNEPSDPGSPDDNPDDGGIWCPMIGD